MVYTVRGVRRTGFESRYVIKNLTLFYYYLGSTGTVKNLLHLLVPCTRSIWSPYIERVGVAAAPADDLPDAVRRLGGMKTGFSGGPWRAGSVEAIRTF